VCAGSTIFPSPFSDSVIHRIYFASIGCYRKKAGWFVGQDYLVIEKQNLGFWNYFFGLSQWFVTICFRKNFHQRAFFDFHI